jgi:hypothetical protein
LAEAAKREDLKGASAAAIAVTLVASAVKVEAPVLVAGQDELDAATLADKADKVRRFPATLEALGMSLDDL